MGGRTYSWPPRVAIIGYGKAKHHGQMPPRVQKLLARLQSECSDSIDNWEVRLQEKMSVRTRDRL